MSIFIRNPETKGIRNWSLKQYTEEQKKGEIERYGTVIPLETKLLDCHARDSHEFTAGVVCGLYARTVQQEAGKSRPLQSIAVEDRLVNYGRSMDGKPLDNKALEGNRNELFVPIGARVSGHGGAGKSKSYMCFDNVLLGEGANHAAHYGLSPEGNRVAILSSSKGGLVISDELLQVQEDSRISPNILQLHRADGERAVYELAQGDLEVMIQRPGAMVPRWMYESLKGALQVTEQGLIHLDLKLNNFFVMEDGTAKVGDLEFFASVVPGGTNYGNFRGGNFAHYSPERRGVVLGREDGGEVSEKDNTWAMMYVLCDMDFQTAGSDRSDPDFRLSPAFRARFKECREVQTNAFKEGSKKYPSDTGAARRFAHEKVLNYLNGLPKDSEGRPNLFAGLKIEKPLDDIVYRMAFVNPEKRISLEQAVELFGLKMMTCDIRRRPAYLKPTLKVEDTLFFSKPKNKA